MGSDESGSLGAWATHASRSADPASLTALASTPASDLTGPELVDAIISSEKALSLLTGLQMRLMAALAVPFIAGDPMRLAARLARKNCITGDDDPDIVQLFVDEAATCLAGSEIAAALRISPVTGGIRVREATSMTTVLAPTLHALEAGLVDRGKARVIAEHCQPLTPEHTAELQDLVLPDAPDLTTSELRELAGEAVIVVDPEADGAVKIFQICDLLATSTAGAAGDSRGIGARRIDALVDIADQLATYGYLDLSDFVGQSVPDSTILDARSNSGDVATGSRVQQDAGRNARASAGGRVAAQNGDAADEDANAGTGTSDAAARGNDIACTGNGVDVTTDREVAAASEVTDLRDAREGAGSAAVSGSTLTPPARGRPARTESGDRSRRALTRQGRRPHLSVTIGLDTLAGLNELPGKLAGFGAIPACLARAIATSAGTVTAIITDPTTGIATDAGALTYRPTQKLRDQVAALLNTCQFPSCRQPVWRCDIDHREPFNHQNPERGGRTEKENAGPFCRRHHLMKHHTDWQIRVSTERFALDWTSPTGHRYSTKPRPVAVPDVRKMTARIITAGTAIAERLDNLTAFNNATESASTNSDQPPEPNSTVEELLTTMLLRHQLNRPEMSYDADASAWDRTAADQPITDRDGNPDRHLRADDTEPPDEPPF